VTGRSLSKKNCLVFNQIGKKMVLGKMFTWYLYLRKYWIRKIRLENINIGKKGYLGKTHWEKG